jgi:hypothetical protein
LEIDKVCYFGPPPYKVVEVETGIATEYPNHGNWSSDKAKAGELQPGFYYVCATGSYYTFFDGEKLWQDRNDWGPPSETHWQETGGYPSEYSKYSFEYQKDWVDPNKYLHDFQVLAGNKEDLEKYLGQERIIDWSHIFKDHHG